MATMSVPPMYTVLLTPPGRFLYDVFLYMPPKADEKLDGTGSVGSGRDDGEVEFAGVNGFVLEEFLETLNKYRLRSKVDIENLAEDFSCWQRFDGNLTRKSSSAEPPEAAAVGWGGATDRSGMSASRRNHLGWKWYRNPRLDCLGFGAPLVEADMETNEDNYLLWRLEKGVAKGSTEIPKGEAMLLEYNLAGLNAISFDKGCYVGQELIARTHHRGVIRRRVLPLKFLNDSGKDAEQRAAPRSDIIVASSGKKAGTVTTALGCCGLGLLGLLTALRHVIKIYHHKAVQVRVEHPFMRVQNVAGMEVHEGVLDLLLSYY